ncbi:uncharacterized protein VTP21DRAFT_6611 [Calcarisporiella thermophila]|uniref:uncharacterized protein n=1 Tax=Calcarisporiella thermophila TaxID=911321 RepID=UPI003742BEB2
MQEPTTTRRPSEDSCVPSHFPRTRRRSMPSQAHNHHPHHHAAVTRFNPEVWKEKFRKHCIDVLFKEERFKSIQRRRLDVMDTGGDSENEMGELQQRQRNLIQQVVQNEYAHYPEVPPPVALQEVVREVAQAVEPVTPVTGAGGGGGGAVSGGEWLSVMVSRKLRHEQPFASEAYAPTERIRITECPSGFPRVLRTKLDASVKMLCTSSPSATLMPRWNLTKMTGRGDRAVWNDKADCTKESTKPPYKIGKFRVLLIMRELEKSMGEAGESLAFRIFN